MSSPRVSMKKANAPIPRAPVLEVIACSVSDAVEAQHGGAGRLEIIRDFERGGMTPPLKLVQDILGAVRLPVRVMLRDTERYEIVGEVEKAKLCDAGSSLLFLIHI